MPCAWTRVVVFTVPHHAPPLLVSPACPSFHAPRPAREPPLFLACAIEPAFPLQFAIHEHQIPGIDRLGGLLSLVTEEIHGNVELIDVPLLAGFLQQEGEAAVGGRIGVHRSADNPPAVTQPQRMTLLMVSMGASWAYCRCVTCTLPDVTAKELLWVSIISRGR